MVTVYPNNFYATQFHYIVKQGGYTSRLMIYSVPANIPFDITDRQQVEEYGTLLKYENADYDSNRRIGQNGIKIHNYYNKDEEYTIGQAPICSIDISLINDDGFFSTYDWTQVIIIYWDVWDETNENWWGVPLGIYWWERPTKTSTVVVEAKANDTMWNLDQNYDAVDIDYTGGLTLAQVYTELVTGIPGIKPYPHPEDWANMTLVTYTSSPFDVTNMTLREQLAKLAEIAGANVYISRDNYVMMKPFTNAYWKPTPQAQPIYYELDLIETPTPIIEIDIGEYTVPLIDKFVAQVGQSGSEYTSGSGDNAMYSINNGFLNIPGASARYTVDGMYGVVSGQHVTSDMVAYRPISLRAFGDPSVEAGDIIRVVYDPSNAREYYPMPIFQQTLFWNGGDWIVEMQNSGFEKRLLPSEIARESYVNKASFSDVEGKVSDLESNAPYLPLAGGTVLGNLTVNGNLNIGADKFDFEKISIAANGSLAINHAALDRKFIVLSSAGSTTRTAIITNSSSASAVTYTALRSASGLSYTTGTGTLTITNSTSNAIRGFIISF